MSYVKDSGYPLSSKNNRVATVTFCQAVHSVMSTVMGISCKFTFRFSKVIKNISIHIYSFTFTILSFTFSSKFIQACAQACYWQTEPHELRKMAYLFYLLAKILFLDTYLWNSASMSKVEESGMHFFSISVPGR